LTDKYQASNPEHRRIKSLIEEGDGLPDMATSREVAQSLRQAGFEVMEERDMIDDSHIEIPWYQPLSPSYNILSQ